MTTVNSQHGRFLRATALTLAICLAGSALADPALAGPAADDMAQSGGRNAVWVSDVPEDATIVPDPSWTCGKPAGIVAPTRGELAFRVTLQLTGAYDLGTTQYGNRRVLDVKSGTVKGARVSGAVLSGGQDLELTLSNGAVELEQRTVLRLDNGTLVVMRNCGVAPAGDQTVRVVGDFEAPLSGAYAWLNTGSYVGTRVFNPAAGTVELTMYDVSKVTGSAPEIKLKDPAGVANQTWDCVGGTGSRGAAVFSETVKMGATLTIGASKRGTRTVMPVLGGPTSGKVVGKVLPGGADFQIGGSPMKMDARYVIVTTATDSPKYIMVHNCGTMSSLVPIFEAQVAGPYGFLTKGKYLSVATVSGADTANVTFYERV